MDVMSRLPGKAAMGCLSAQRRGLAGSGFGGSSPLSFKSHQSERGMILNVFMGPKTARRIPQNYMAFMKRNRRGHKLNVPTLYEVFTERMRPEKDLAFGDRFLSKRSHDVDELFPHQENPYDDGRDYKMGNRTLVEDLTPHLLHHVDDRVSEAVIRYHVALVAKHASTVEDLMVYCTQWGWRERMESLSSRLIVHHLVLLASVVSSQHDLRQFRIGSTQTRGLLRTSSGDRFFALPGQPQSYA
ncbi:hypothetical protein DIPPA_17272 [Diplonema papillatum]|nr:hypothetical protein DIPPA_17272 [Diplonema papillatum]